MKLPILKDVGSLCDQCVALCCRYYAFEIEKPTTLRDFEDLRWYMFHDDTIIFVEDDRWYIQINRPCKALLPDNRCGVYENRPAICREYTTKNCDWHGDDYEYEHLFTEPDQIQRFGREYLAEKRKRRRKAAKVKANGSKARANGEPARPRGKNGEPARPRAGGRGAPRSARNGQSTANSKQTAQSKTRSKARPGLPVRLLKTA